MVMANDMCQCGEKKTDSRVQMGRTTLCLILVRQTSMSMGSGEESIISSSCFCRPSATAWMALVHSSLREAHAAERLHQPIYHHASPAAQSRNCLLINRKAISRMSSANSQWTLCECITMIKCVCLCVLLHVNKTDLLNCSTDFQRVNDLCFTALRAERCVLLTCLSSGVSTWKVRSMTVVHCRQRMINVLGLGRSVFISWHSDHSRGEREGRRREGPMCRGVEERDRPTVIAIYLYRQPNRHCRPIWKRTGALRWRKTTQIFSAPLKLNIC